jgi:hypothetical protein
MKAVVPMNIEAFDNAPTISHEEVPTKVETCTGSASPT